MSKYGPEKTPYLATFHAVYNETSFVINKIHSYKSIQAKGNDHRRSRTEVFCKKVILKNITKFTGKHLFLSLFFNKVMLLACNFLRKETPTQLLPVSYATFLRTPFLIEHLQWLLLLTAEPHYIFTFGFF